MNKKYRDYKELVKEDLKTEKDLQLYLDIAVEDYLETGDKGEFLSSLRLASEVKGGLTKLSRKTNLQREHLYTILSKRGNPSFENVIKIIKALGYDLMLKPI
tara:strand:- start:1939 stop:2244 length:306 start_codon:yes stop_codon:yes gene_type:complete